MSWFGPWYGSWFGPWYGDTTATGQPFDVRFIDGEAIPQILTADVAPGIACSEVETIGTWADVATNSSAIHGWQPTAPTSLLGGGDVAVQELTFDVDVGIETELTEHRLGADEC